MLVSVEEVLIVFIVFQSFFNTLLLLSVRVPHFIRAARGAVFPVLIGLLVIEISSRGVSEDQLVISSTLLRITND